LCIDKKAHSGNAQYGVAELSGRIFEHCAGAGVF
jgi:hypothetical protein